MEREFPFDCKRTWFFDSLSKGRDDSLPLFYRMEEKHPVSSTGEPNRGEAETNPLRGCLKYGKMVSFDHHLIVR